MAEVKHYKLQRIRAVRDDFSSPRIILHEGELWKVESWYWEVHNETISVDLFRWSYHEAHKFKKVTMPHDSYVLRYMGVRQSMKTGENIRDAFESAAAGALRVPKDRIVSARKGDTYMYRDDSRSILQPLAESWDYYKKSPASAGKEELTAKCV